MYTDFLLRCNTPALYSIRSHVTCVCPIAPHFILLILMMVLSACQPTSEAPITTPTIVVSNNANGADTHSDITSAVNSAPPGTHIQITEGTYIVNNPIILDTRDIKLHGSGTDKTIILAKNANQPIFQIKANGITIESVTINALIDNGPERASFAILIQEGKGNCKIAQTKIINTAATAIIGRSASGCTLVSNTILNSGDDAVRLAGNHLTVVDNTIVGYFDEALDLARGSNIVVTGNYVANGRIGIVVDDCSNTVVSQNFVENQILQGIVTGTDPNAIVTANTVKNAGNIGYNLHTPQVVSDNQAIGKNQIGFRLTNMAKGIFSGNTTQGSSDGFVFKNEADINGEAQTIAGASKDITLYDNCEQLPLENNDTSCTYHTNKDYPFQNTAGDVKASDQFIYSFSQPVEVSGASPSDKKRADKVAELLKYYNPGFLSIQIDNAMMKSEITTDLYETIKETGSLGIGLVRAPFLEFSRGGERSFLWHLSVDGKDVVVVSSIYNGPKARTLILDNNGELSLMDSAVLIKDKVFFKLFK